MQAPSDGLLLTLIAHSVYELNLSRRELIRPDLNEQYKQLCSSQTPISKFLFGDDLPKAVKERGQTLEPYGLNKKR